METEKPPLQEAAPQPSCLLSHFRSTLIKFSVLIVLPEPTVPSQGGESQRNRGGSGTPEGKRAVALQSQRTVCLLRTGKHRRLLLRAFEMAAKPQKLIGFPPHSNDQSLLTGQRKGATSWLDVTVGPIQATEDPSHTF